MNQRTTNRLNLFRPVICLAGLLAAMTGFTAGNTLIPADSNTGLIVENAVINGGTTTVLFWTYPNISDPGAGKECPLNFYTVSLQPGLPTAVADLAAKDVCGNSLSRARLLANNDVLILAVGRLERWRAGEQLSIQAFSDISATSKMAIDAGNGGQWHGMTAAGDVVLAVPAHAAAGENAADAGLQVVSLDADAGLRWQLQLREAGQMLMVEKLWATTGGGALLHTNIIAADHSSLGTQGLLYFIDANGSRKEPLQLTVKDQQPDLAQMISMSPAEVQKEMQRMSESHPESIKKLEVDARPDGGFDVLLHREGGLEGREGYFLMRFGADGSLQSEKTVTGQLASYGLDDFRDFHVDGNSLVLLSRVSASQPSVQSKRKTWSQNVIGIVDLDNNTLETRLLPLDLRYLQAAMDAGDAGLQYLANWPGGEPVLLSQVGGIPFAIARGHLSSRSALRLDEASSDLPSYTEAFDNQRNDAARQAVREQRKGDQAATKAQLNADLAAAVGMSPEEFSALSNQERKQVMLNSGNYDALAEAGMKQAPEAQPSLPTGAEVQDINTQIAAAMAQAQQSLPPEMAEQLNAALAQVQQEMGTSGMSPPSAVPSAEAAASSDATETGVSAFSMTVMDAFKISGRGVAITGKVDEGIVRVGETVCLIAAKIGTRELKVEAVERGATTDSAKAGDMPGIVVNGVDVKDISRNDQLRSSCFSNR